MALLTIPEEYFDALEAILTLSEESLQELRLALESTPASIREHIVPEDALANIKTISADEIEDIAQTLISLSFVRDKAGVDTAEFVEDAVESVEEQEFINPDIFEEKRELFRERLISLLDSKAISIASRARTVLVDHEHDLCSADLLTDIRPVFQSDDDTNTGSAVLVHTLKISYHQNNRIKEFYVTLDTQDLEWLGRLIERAKGQAESLKTVIKAANLSYIDV